MRPRVCTKCGTRLRNVRIVGTWPRPEGDCPKCGAPNMGRSFDLPEKPADRMELLEARVSALEATIVGNGLILFERQKAQP